MRIEIIVTYWREEMLIPLFMQHYAPWADQITCLTFKYPNDKMDETIRMAEADEAIARSTADWVAMVDTDEFIFPKPYGTDPRAVLEAERAAGNTFIVCEMPRVWRHETEKDLDFSRAPIPQRIHGEPLATYPMETKPCLYKPFKGMRVHPGNHTLHYPNGHQGNTWGGAHWHTADPCLSDRILKRRKDRVKPEDLARGICIHYKHLDAETLARAYLAHSREPVVLEIGHQRAP